MNKFDKLLKKLQPVPNPTDYVTDPYDEKAMNADVAGYSNQLQPEDLEKLHYAETTGGKYLQNPESSASGQYQLTDSTRKLAENLAKQQEIDQNTANPLRKDAILMKALVNKYENSLENAKNGPFEPNLDNIYLMHHYGVQGGLNALNAPKSGDSAAKFKEVKKLLSRMPKGTDNSTAPAKNILDLLGEE